MYIVRIVGPAGDTTYLCRGREVGYEAATRYPHPSNARVALDGYKKKHPRLYGDVIDDNDPERSVL